MEQCPNIVKDRGKTQSCLITTTKQLNPKPPKPLKFGFLEPQCVDGAGVTSDAMCDLEIKPPSSIACQQSNMTCNNCLQNNCSGHGSCSVRCFTHSLVFCLLFFGYFPNDVLQSCIARTSSQITSDCHLVLSQCL